MLKVVALDIGGVCINLHHKEALSSLGITDIRDIPAEFTCATNMLEKGIITTAEWMNFIRYISENKFSEHELRKAWKMIIGDAIEGMPELAQELVDAGCKLAFFSDTSEMHAQEVYRSLSFANLVTGSVFSYEVGCKKPDAGMYEAFENEYGKPIFYADDHEVNVDAGKRKGWNSHFFTSTANMRQALVDARIL
jgi:putative hydrolase of the HAD superfamily